MDTERKVMQGYLDALVKRADFPAYFTDDVLATFEGTDQRSEGCEAAGQLIRYVHQGAFDARMELKDLLTDDDKAAIEADFTGTHTGEFEDVIVGTGTRQAQACFVSLLHGKWLAKASETAYSETVTGLLRVGPQPRPPGHNRPISHPGRGGLPPHMPIRHPGDPRARMNGCAE